MAYRRKQLSNLEQLLRWRKNVFVQAPGGGYLIVCATGKLIGVSQFNGVSVVGDADKHHILLLDDHPDLAMLHDGNGWDLAALAAFICDEKRWK